jgi:hypothetical protein
LYFSSSHSSSHFYAQGRAIIKAWGRTAIAVLCCLKVRRGIKNVEKKIYIREEKMKERKQKEEGKKEKNNKKRKKETKKEKNKNSPWFF